MRLIDADALLLELELLQDEADAKYHETDFDSFYGGGCSMIQEVIKGVEKQPTTFDVDKVIGQLERDKFIESETILSDIHQGYNAGLSRAIEIVKQGGKPHLILRDSETTYRDCIKGLCVTAYLIKWQSGLESLSMCLTM